MKKDYLDSVSEFHNTFGHPILVKSEIPSSDRCELRIELLREELEELQHAIYTKNIEDAADALCDLQYILSGTVLEFGMRNKFEAMFEEVHRSNMSKACNTREEAELTVKKYKEESNTEAYIKEVQVNNTESLFLVYRTSDNKTLKSINYSPANLKGLL